MILFVHFRQESLLALVDAQRHVDLIHSMSYDQGGAQHSPRYITANMEGQSDVIFYRELAEKTIRQARAAGLPMEKLTLGVPFYGRYPGFLVNNCVKFSLLFDLVYLLVDCLQLLCIFRDSDRGDWVTYEDLIQQHNDLLPEDDSVVKVVMEKGDVKERKIIGFNGEGILG